MSTKQTLIIGGCVFAGALLGGILMHAWRCPDCRKRPERTIADVAAASAEMDSK